MMVVGVYSPELQCYQSRCYFVSKNQVNQSTARDRCHEENAELVSISDEDENNFVTSIWSVN